MACNAIVMANIRIIKSANECFAFGIIVALHSSSYHYFTTFAPELQGRFCHVFPSPSMLLFQRTIFTVNLSGVYIIVQPSNVGDGTCENLASAIELISYSNPAPCPCISENRI